MNRALDGLGVIAGLMVALMMFLTFADVVGRYVFNRPLFGAFELTEVLLGLVIFVALPLATRHREHITVPLLLDALPASARRLLLALTNAVCGLLSGLLAWRVWLYGERLLASGETTLELGIKRGLIGHAMALLLALTALVFLLNAWRDLSGTGEATEQT